MPASFCRRLAEGIVRLLDKPHPRALAQELNIGANSLVERMEFLRIMEENLGNKAEVQLLPLQSGDGLQAYAGFRPETPLQQGLNVPFHGV